MHADLPLVHNIWQRFIFPLPTTFRMVKNYFFEVTPNKFNKLIWLLKLYMPSNKTGVVLFLTKNEKADADIGVNYTPEVVCFFKIVKIQCCRYDLKILLI